MISILKGGLPLCVDLWTTKDGLKRAALSPASSFCCRFIEGEPIVEIVHWLEAYSLKKQTLLDFPLDRGGLTEFQSKGPELLSSIPFGKVQTYGEIAEQLGHRRFARAIGMVCRTNPWPLFIPCHRVVASGNKMGGFAYGLPMKKMLLEFEDITEL